MRKRCYNGVQTGPVVTTYQRGSLAMLTPADADPVGHADYLGNCGINSDDCTT